MGKWGKAIRRRALSHCILEKQKLHSSDFVNYKFWYIRKELHSILLHSSSPSSPSRHCYYCRVLNCASSSCVPSQFACYRIQINFRSGFASLSQCSTLCSVGGNENLVEQDTREQEEKREWMRGWVIDLTIVSHTKTLDLIQNSCFIEKLYDYTYGDCKRVHSPSI